MRDTGVGIPPTRSRLIFEEFYQIGVSPNSSRDGYGLGLSIVQRIARLLDIRVDVSSTPGQARCSPSNCRRSRRRTAAASAATAPADAAAKPSGAHILLVEDEPGVRNAMRMLFKVEGYRVTVAAGAGEAFQKLRTEGFDLLVTDYHLEGGQTGTQVIAAARELLGAGLQGHPRHRRHVRGGARNPVRHIPAHRQQADQFRGAAGAGAHSAMWGMPEVTMKKLLFMVVDDDAGIRSAMRALLKSVGLESQLYTSAQGVLAAYQPAQPGCLLLDIRMPGMSGLELQQQLNLLGAADSGDFHDGRWRCADGGRGHAAWRLRFPAEAIPDQELLDRAQRALVKMPNHVLPLGEHSRIRHTWSR